MDSQELSSLVVSENKVERVSRKSIKLDDLKESVHSAMQKGLYQMSLIIQCPEVDPRTKIGAFNSVVNMGRYVMAAEMLDKKYENNLLDISSFDFIGK